MPRWWTRGCLAATVDGPVRRGTCARVRVTFTPMAHLLGAEPLVTLTLGTRTLLDEVSLGLDDGARIGVVGPNGAGKSTLLRVLSGQQEPDAGRITRAGGVRVVVLDQRDQLAPGRTVLDVVHGSADEHEWAADSRIRSVHAGLLADVSLDTEVDSLSGGQRRPRRAGRPPRARRGGACPGRADQPPRRRGRRLAGRAPGRALWARAGRARRRHARPLVPRRGGHAHLGGPRRRCRPVKEGGYAAYVLARAGRGPGPPFDDPGGSGRTCSARSSPGCAGGGARRARPSRSSGSTPRPSSSPTSRPRATSSP